MPCYVITLDLIMIYRIIENVTLLYHIYQTHINVICFQPKHWKCSNIQLLIYNDVVLRTILFDYSLFHDSICSCFGPHDNRYSFLTGNLQLPIYMLCQGGNNKTNIRRTCLRYTFPSCRNLKCDNISYTKCI